MKGDLFSLGISTYLIGRRRHWFPIEEANKLLSMHKPLQQSYLKLFFKLKEEQLLSVQIPFLVIPDASAPSTEQEEK